MQIATTNGFNARKADIHLMDGPMNGVLAVTPVAMQVATGSAEVVIHVITVATTVHMTLDVRSAPAGHRAHKLGPIFV